MNQSTHPSTENETSPAAAAAVEQPSFWKWLVSLAGSVGLAGMLCCVAPAVLFMFGIMGGAYAISFANFFYEEDGSAGVGAWVLRGLAVAIGIGGVILYRRKQNQCSINPNRKKLNFALIIGGVAVLGVGAFFTLEKASGWFFDEYIVPAQQAELEQQQQAGS
ncbi:MAG: hypothetical protein AAGH99_01350 [Planctomycetota bacterium]